jgi:flagellar assembly protein FliH
MSSSSSPGAGALDAAIDFSFDQFDAPPPPPRQRHAAEARAEAEQLLAAAAAEAEAIRREARQEGFDQGFQAGMATAREECEPLLNALAEALHDAQDLRAQAADAAEERAVELALQIAEKVVAGALDVQPERVVDVVRGALRCLVERERVTILVNTLDLDLVRESLDSLRSTLGGMENVEVQEERRVPRGGARVRSGSGEVDATIETKLERAREAIAAELAR